MRTNTKRQSGAALVVAMLILSLVIVFAASMMVEYNFSIRRVSNQMAAQQAYSYLRAAETFAYLALKTDTEDDKDSGQTVDTCNDIWAQETAPFVDFEKEHSYNGRLYDLQGRFNLNSLRDTVSFPPGSHPNVPYTNAQGIFIRLLQTMGDPTTYSVSYDEAVAITEAIVDWLDQDTDSVGYSCGEDDAYYNIDGRPPHRTSNLHFSSITELQLICNINMHGDFQLYNDLLDHITVWPASGNSTININTATPEVLRSIIVTDADAVDLKAVYTKNKTSKTQTNYNPPPPVDVGEVANIMAVQSDVLSSGYSDFSSINPDFPGHKLWPKESTSLIGLSSDYFLLEAEATVSDVTQRLSSVISREGGNIVVLARSTGGLYKPGKYEPVTTACVKKGI